MYTYVVGLYFSRPTFLTWAYLGGGVLTDAKFKPPNECLAVIRACNCSL